jgi:NAD+ synthase (glutamine-hydrolysing)
MKKQNAGKIRIALCQINTLVGDINGNRDKILSNLEKCREEGCDLAAFPELSITGYPPEDLLLKPAFIDDNLRALKEIVEKCEKISAVVGFVDRKGLELYNSAAIIHNKKIVAVYNKICLPNYGVFDEKRYFSAGEEIKIVKLNGFSFGVAICEDIWDKKGPAQKLSAAGADLILAINASPYFVGKWEERHKAGKDIIKTNKNYFAYLNLVGGQDEIVFDGHSFILDPKGNVVSAEKQFEEDILFFDIETLGRPLKRNKGISVIPVKSSNFPLKTNIKLSNPKPLPKTAEIYKALWLGLRDYVIKNGFKKVILGLSGGIDSALVAAIAKDALGSENVKALFMPSQYTAPQSRADAFETAKNLGIDCTEIPITDLFAQFLKDLEVPFSGTQANIAEENLQARIRGNLLMAFSNKFGYLVLATGNKSEVSTGYSTLYGDMCGGLSVIKDVPKTLVYELVNYRNSVEKVIPECIINRPPTAELKPDQKDQDTLPPYDVLDKIIEGYVENDMNAAELAGADGRLPKTTVEQTISLIDKNEYKRRQSAPGIKITPKSFGKDRRMPITNGYKNNA